LQHPTLHFFDLTDEDLREWCSDHGLAPFRARQIQEWVYVKGIADPAAMSNLSKSDRDRLASEITFISGETVAHQRASDGTQKLLIEWTDRQECGGQAQSDIGGIAKTTPLPILGVPTSDGGRFGRGNTSLQTECVMIPYGEEVFASMGKEAPDDLKERRTACISSQVGCPVGCKFCASGIGGLDGNLSAGRIVEQVWRLRQLEGVGRISNVVFMGMGEPLSNLTNVTRAIRTLNAAAPHGLGIGARKITISTVGLPKAIEKLADELDLPITLALSLHAPNDELRRELIPWAEYTTIPELLGACQKWFTKTGREITLEYVLLGGVNDQGVHAHELARVAKTLRANVNLIRYNEVKGMPFCRPADADVRTFQNILRDANINTHIRASRGRDIAAACGQLRHEKMAV